MQRTTLRRPMRGDTRQVTIKLTEATEVGGSIRCGTPGTTGTYLERYDFCKGSNKYVWKKLKWLD